MRTKRIVSIGAALAAAGSAAALVPGLVQADSGSGALQNDTPGSQRLVHTGGITPNASWNELGRLVLPVGSWAVRAQATFLNKSSVATGIDCYLKVPGGSAHVVGSLAGGRGQDVGTLDTQTVVNAPNGGPADLLCNVRTNAADRKVWSQDVSIQAISVSGTTHTTNPAPAASAVSF